MANCMVCGDPCGAAVAHVSCVSLLMQEKHAAEQDCQHWSKDYTGLQQALYAANARAAKLEQALEYAHKIIGFFDERFGDVGFRGCPVCGRGHAISCIMHDVNNFKHNYTLAALYAKG